MTLSNCCGAETKVECRSDHPFYDDFYDLVIRFQICTSCGKTVGLEPNEPHHDKNRERD